MPSWTWRGRGLWGTKATTPACSKCVPLKMPTMPGRSLHTLPRCSPKPLPSREHVDSCGGVGRAGERLPAQRESHCVLIVGSYHHFSFGIVLQLLQDIVEAPGENAI